MDTISFSSDLKLLSNNRVLYSFLMYFIFENADLHTSVLPKRPSISLANSGRIGYLIALFPVSSKFSSSLTYCTSCSSFFIRSVPFGDPMEHFQFPPDVKKQRCLKVFEIFSKS